MFLKKIFKTPSSIGIRLRLALIFVLLFGTTMLAFNLLLFQVMISTLQKDFDDALFNYSVDISDVVDISHQVDLSSAPLKIDNKKILPFPLGTALIQVRHHSGRVLARVGNFGTFNPPYKKDLERIWKGEEATYRTMEHIQNIPAAEADSYRLITIALDSGPQPQFLLQIAVPLTLLETQIQKRLTLLQLGIPIILIVATLGGLFLSARALQPVNNIINIAKEIKASELSKRVPVPNVADQVQQLSLTFNEMLDRIQQAFQSQERFVADASHQLLTPLTIMRGELELLQKSKERNVDQFIKSSLQEVDNLSNIIKKMLLLARVDAGLGALNVENLPFDELVFEALAQCEKLAQTKNITLKMIISGEITEEPPLIRGDKDLLINLILNIVENAIKYSAKDDSIQLDLQFNEQFTKLIVSDNGPGIPEEDLPLIFERFSRGAGSNTKVKGFGLGLAIAQQISLLHNAKLTVKNKSPHGAQFAFEIKNI